ncbi:hypothetical protein [Persicobacter diffluens]|uniref:Autotransporter domain-containing protein n=1 Tax=Persicobacter diffluens TaxID=981 RepID=A0AAN5AL72_9BACT|nr:hypothetical protein PEDI_35010 [Persicobacter diffluens]
MPQYTTLFKYRAIGAVFFFVCLLSPPALAQNSVGIGTNTPNQRAILHLNAPNGDQGILIPQMTTSQRMQANFSDNENGMLVYDFEEGQFFFWHGGNWYPLLKEFKADAGGDLEGIFPNPIIKNDAVTNAKIIDNAITTAKLTDGAVINSKLADDAIDNAKIQSDAIATENIQDFAITIDKITDGAVQTTKIADAAISTAKLNDQAVSSIKIANNSILNEDISTSAAITDNKLATISTAGKVANTATTATSANTPSAIVSRDTNGDFIANNISANTFSGNLTGDVSGDILGNASTASALESPVNVNFTGEVNGILSTFDGSTDAIVPVTINNDAITNAKILNDAITTNKISDGGVMTSDIADVAVTTIKIQNAAVTNTKIAGDAVESSHILDGTIIAGDIAGNAINSAHITDGTVQASDIGTGEINNTLIANDAVTTAKMIDGSVTTEKIADGTIMPADLNPQGNDKVLATDNLGNVSWIDKVSLVTFGAGDGLTFDNAANTMNISAEVSQFQINGSNRLQLQPNAIQNNELANDAVTTAEILNATIEDADISGTAAITGTKINPDFGGQNISTTAGVNAATVNTTGTATLATVDINNGTIDGTTLGASNPAAATVTNLIASGTVALPNDAIQTAEIQDANITEAKLDKANIPLSGFGNPTAAVNMGSQKITNLADPTTPQDAATQNYVDNQLTSSNALTDAHIFIGNAGNVKAEQSMSGDATMANNGLVTISNNAIGSAEITDGSIADADINAGAAIAGSKINPDFVGQTIATTGNTSTNTLSATGTATLADVDIAAGEIDGTTIGANSAAPATFTNLSTTGVVDLGTNAIQTAEIQDNQITTAKVADNNITNAKLDKANIPLSGFGAAAADVSVGNNKLIDIADPTATQDAATKHYVDTQITSSENLTDATLWIGDGTNQRAEQSISGDATLANDGTMTITADAISNVEIADGTILNADINGLAAIAGTKVDPDFGAQLISTTGTANLATVDVGGGNIDGTTIGATAAAPATVTNLTASGTVTLGTDAIQTAEIQDAQITTAKVADANITEAKLDKANIPLSGFGAAAADVSMGTNTITNLADPTNAQDAATMNFVTTQLALSEDLSNGSIWIGDATGDRAEQTMGGDATIATDGTVTIANNAIGSAEITDGTIINDDIANTTITDAKLATISTAGKVANSATTATDANTANAIVARDAAGDFAANDITANAFIGPITGNASTATALETARDLSFTGDVTGSITGFDGSGNGTTALTIAAGSIVDADINAAAAIVDSKLATISTAGKVANSATTATDANTANAIVARDAAGDFAANDITANAFIGPITGNASTATALETARDLSFTGDVTGSITGFDGTGNGTTALTIAAGTIVDADINAAAAIVDSKLATISTAGKVANSATSATDANTANAIVARDAAGDFAANDITANAFIGPITGNASTATALETARDLSFTGDVTGSITGFDGTGNGTTALTIAAGSIVDADINAAAAIADSKLATISTAGKVANSATTATDANTANAIVARDAAGDFTANDITANAFIGTVTGNASTATALETARDLSFTGDVTGSITGFDGTGNGTTALTIAAGSIVDADINASAAIADSKLATISTAGKVANTATTATDANTANAIVARDAAGDFTTGKITSTGLKLDPTNGSFVSQIQRFQGAGSATTISGGGSFGTFTISGFSGSIATTANVIVNPTSGMGNVIITYCGVTGANTIEVGVYNLGGSNFDASTITFNVCVIQ